MNFTSQELVNLISAYFYPFVRISTVFMASPVFGATAIVPVKIRLMLALAITFVTVPVIPEAPVIDPMSSIGVMVLLQQILLGLAMGFLLQLAFATLAMGGSGISMPMGLSFANMIDPVNGVQVPVLSSLFTIIGTLLFLAADVHLILIQVMVESFQTMPVGPIGISKQSMLTIALWGGNIFMGGMLIALPAIIIITLINMAFGVMTKAAPQLNIFAVGFPTTMMAGFLVVYLTLPTLLPRFMQMIEEAFATMHIMLGAN